MARERRMKRVIASEKSQIFAVLSLEAVTIRLPSGPCSGPVRVSVAVVPELRDLLTGG